MTNTSLPREYVPRWSRPGRDWHPDDLPAHMDEVDAGIREVVQRVNESGWAWTLESCEGHEPPAFSAHPLLGLAVRDEHLGQVLALLVRCVEPDSTRMVDLRAPRVVLHRITPGRLDGWHEVRVIVESANHTEAMAVLERFAEQVGRGGSR